MKSYTKFSVLAITVYFMYIGLIKSASIKTSDPKKKNLQEITNPSPIISPLNLIFKKEQNNKNSVKKTADLGMNKSIEIKKLVGTKKLASVKNYSYVS